MRMLLQLFLSGLAFVNSQGGFTRSPQGTPMYSFTGSPVLPPGPTNPFLACWVSSASAGTTIGGPVHSNGPILNATVCVRYSVNNMYSYNGFPNASYTYLLSAPVVKNLFGCYTNYCNTPVTMPYNTTNVSISASPINRVTATSSRQWVRSNSMTANPSMSHSPTPTYSLGVRTSYPSPSQTASPSRTSALFGSPSPSQTNTPSPSRTSAESGSPSSTQTTTQTPSYSNTPTSPESQSATTSPSQTTSPTSPESQSATTSPSQTTSPTSSESQSATTSPSQTATPTSPESQSATTSPSQTATPTSPESQSAATSASSSASPSQTASLTSPESQSETSAVSSSSSPSQTATPSPESATSAVSNSPSPTYSASTSPSQTATTSPESATSAVSGSPTPSPSPTYSAPTSSSRTNTPTPVVNISTTVGNTVIVRINKQTEKQISDPNTYLYVRMSVLCQTKKSSGTITKIAPIGSSVAPYNVPATHPVNSASAAQCTTGRSLRANKHRMLETLYDVDITVETTDSLAAEEQSSKAFVIWFSVGIGGFVLVIISMITVIHMRRRPNKLTTRINSSNPLNEVPVIIPWANKTGKPWSLSDVSNMNRNDFIPLQARRNA